MPPQLANAKSRASTLRADPEREVRQILGRSDLIQKQHKTAMRVIAGVLGENDGNEDPDSPAKSKKVVEEFDKIDHDTINTIIAKQLRVKRLPCT